MTHILLEALYYSGGLKTRLYGADERPINWPTSDQIGLQNDVVLAGQQYAVELARFRINTTAVTLEPTGITWLALFRPSSDIVGNRDNFCGAGLWIVDGIRFNAEVALDVLFKTSLQLQENIPRDYGAPLPKAVNDTFNRAVGFINEHFRLDLNQGKGGFPYGDNKNFSSQYIFLPGDEQSLPELADAITVACAIRTNIHATRLVFVSGLDVDLNSAKTAGKILHTPRAIYSQGRATSELVNELFVARATLEKISAKRTDYEREILELKLKNQNAADVIAELEHSCKEKDVLLDSFTRPDINRPTLEDLDQICGKIVSGVETRLDQAMKNRTMPQRQIEQSPASSRGKSSTLEKDLQTIKALLERMDTKISRIGDSDFAPVKKSIRLLGEPSIFQTLLNSKLIFISSVTLIMVLILAVYLY